MSVFNGCSVYINGDVKSKSTLSKTIKDNGGTIAFMIGKSVTHFITTDADFQSQNSNIKKAVSYSLNIVSEDWVNDSVSKGTQQDVKNYGFTLVEKKSAFASSPMKSPIRTTPATTTTTTEVTSSLSALSIGFLVNQPTGSLFDQPSEKKNKPAPKKASPAKPVSTPQSSFGSSPTSFDSTPTSFGSTPTPTSFGSTSFGSTSFGPTPTSFGPTPTSFGSTPTSFGSTPTSFGSTSTPTSFGSTLSSFGRTPSTPFGVTSSLASLSSSALKDYKLQPLNVGKLFTCPSASEPSFPETYEVEIEKTLQCSLISGESSNNKFYHLELHTSHSNKIFRLLTRYGRTDGKITTESRYYNDYQSAKTQFNKVLSEKTSDSKGYEEVALISSSMSFNPRLETPSRPFNPQTKTASPEVTQLVDAIFNEATKHLTTTCAVTITSRGIETPLGVLSTAQVEKGEAILDRIFAEIKKPLPHNHKVLEDLSSKFYTAIPYKLGRGSSVSQHLITNIHQLNDKMELLQLMKDLIKISGDGTLQSASEMKYLALKNTIQVLEKSDPRYSQLEKSVLSHAPAHATIEKIYTLYKPNENINFSSFIKPTQLLLHGSRFANFVGLLSRGMLLPKVVVSTGSSRSDFGFLGTGIYFADHFERSMQYARPSLENQSTRLMLVSEVALGKVKEYTKLEPSLNAPPTGFNSCKGVGKATSPGSDFDHDEYVIYNTDQQKQAYLIQFTFEVHHEVKPATHSTKITFKKPTPGETVEATASIREVKGESKIMGTLKLDGTAIMTKPSFHAEELELRKKFANGTAPKDKFINCSDIFTDPTANETVVSQDLEFIMPFEHKKRYMTQARKITSQREFNDSWSAFSGNMFDQFNWSNVFAAGGSILGCTLANPIGFESSDVDLFLYDLSESEANEKLRYISSFIKQKCPSTITARTKYAVTFLNEYPFRNVQVVLRIYKSPAEVLMGFDIDCCSIGYDGSTVRAIPRAISAIVHGYNSVDMTRRSTTYESRLFKYSKRGFAVYVPGFRRSQVPPSIYSSCDVRNATGLQKLLLLEFSYTSNPNNQISNLLKSNEQSDYSDVDMPWGKLWRTSQQASYLIYKDKSHFFATKKENKHRHIVIVGEDNQFTGKASWCRKCQNNQPVDNEEGYVSAQIKWVTQDPGRQLLTGSFHPINDNEWYTFKEDPIAQLKADILANRTISSSAPTIKPTSYSKKVSNRCYEFVLASNHLVAIAAAFGKTQSLRSLLSNAFYKQFINVATESGYYPIHYAVLSNNGECVSILIENGAIPMMRSLNSHRIAPFTYSLALGRHDILRQLPPAHGRKAYQVQRLASNFRIGVSSETSNPTDDINALTKLIQQNPTAPPSDSIGQNLLHLSIFSRSPASAFKMVYRAYPELATKPNMFGQTPLSYVLAALSSIETWNFDNQISYLISPATLNELQEIYLSLNIGENNKNISYTGIPFAFIRIMETSSLASPSIQKPPTFGSGGKFGLVPTAFSTQPSVKPFGVPVSAQPFGVPSSQPFGVPSFHPFGVPSSIQPFGVSQPPQSQVYTKKIAHQSTNTGFQAPGHLTSFPQPQPSYQYPTGVTSTYDFQIPSKSHPNFADYFMTTEEFRNSSTVAKCLSIIAQIGTHMIPHCETVKTHIFSCQLPMINAFEAFMLHKNQQSLLQDIHIALQLDNSNNF